MKKYNITVNGTSYEVVVEEVSADSSFAPTQAAPAVAPKATPAVNSEKPKAATAAPAGAEAITSPMPGTILEVKVSAGQTVKKGDVICVLEAMKMENDIPAPTDGVIASVNAQKGATVAAGDVLATLK